MKQQKKNKRNIPLIVLGIISAAYVVLYFINRELFSNSIDKFSNLVVQIAPYLVIVFFIMLLNFWFIKPEMVKKYLGSESGIKGYLFAIIAGIVSVGSVYVWYPLLKDLKSKGMTDKLVAIFIYNRAIKLHLLPLMALYFGLKFTVVLTLVTVIFSLVVGYSVNRFEKIISTEGA